MVKATALRLRRVVLALGLASCGAAVVAVACGPGDLRDLTAGRADAAVDAAADADAAVCNHAVPPERPTTPDGPNTPGLVFAFDSVRFDTGEQEGGAPKPKSLDLDRTCTCDEPRLEPESCIAPDAGATKRVCDGIDGRDNAAGPLLAAAASAGDNFGPAAFEGQVRAGVFNVIVSLQGWNGLPDDPAVVVGVQLSGGTDDEPGDAGRTKPRFDGTDVWSVTPASVLGGGDLVGTDCRTLKTTCIPTRSDAMAYVRDGMVVAHLDLALPVVTSTSSFVLEFVAATVTATMVKEGDHFRVVGEIAGRWPIDRLLPSLARIPNPLNPGHALCATDAGMQIYEVAKKTACDALDLTANPALDNKNVRCDAISNSISFTGVTAVIGTVRDLRKLDNECPDFKDTCAN